MSYYKVTLYGDDENIEASRYDWELGDEVVEYGDEVEVSVESGYEVRFTCDAVEGYEFSRWVYRVGSLSSEQQFSEDNPFYYDGSDGDIYIRAEAVEIPTWTLLAGSCDVTNELELTFPLDKMEINRLKLNFDRGGTVTIVSSSDGDPVGYFSSSVSDINNNGVPKSYDIQDDDGGGDGQFKIVAEVEAGKDYYLWFRLYNGQNEAEVTIRFFMTIDDGWREICPIMYDGSTWKSMGTIMYDGSTWRSVKIYIYEG